MAGASATSVRFHPPQKNGEVSSLGAYAVYYFLLLDCKHRIFGEKIVGLFFYALGTQPKMKQCSDQIICFSFQGYEHTLAATCICLALKLTSSLPQISLPPQTSLSPTSSLPQISLPPTPFSSPPSQSPPPLLGDSSHLQSLPSLAEEKPSLNHFPFSQSSSHLLLRPITFPLAPPQPPCSSGQTQRVSCFRGS